MKKIILFIMGLVFAVAGLKAQQIAAHKIDGTVLSAKDGKPLAGTSLFMKNSGSRTVTNSSGYFSISQMVFPDTLVITRIGYNGKQVAVGTFSEDPLVIRLDPSSMQLQQVTVSTGYQKIPKERATGSFDFIDNKLLNRSVSPDIMTRLKGVTSGLLFDDALGNDMGVSIRGRSTIFASTQPLVVVDNFPYNGDINAINPNNVESITILKDAAAASIWGARAGNGVIVITTKKGTYRHPLQVNVRSSVTLSEKPDLFSLPVMAASDFIDVETFLFKKGYYNDMIHSSQKPGLSPVVDLLNKVETGQLSAKEAQAAIEQLRQQDVRHDFSKYLYRRAAQQQYSLSISGGGENQRYYFSTGYDNDLSRMVGDRYQRYSIKGSNTYSLFHQKLQLYTGVYWQQSLTDDNGLSPAIISYGNSSILYPYARLADADGNSLSIPKYNQNYIDTAGDGKLLDWNYRPLDELHNGEKSTTGTAFRLNLGVKYKIFSGLDLDVRYRYEKQSLDFRNLQNLGTFYTRDYINRFSSINTSTGEVTYAVPVGGILDIRSTDAVSQNIRGQLNYSMVWNNRHRITAIAGAEIGDRTVTGKRYRYYGYDPDHETSAPVDLANRYETYITGRNSQIYDGQGSSYLQDRNVSVYANAAYSYDDRLMVSASARKDASNLFGVRANQKWVPLWSIGAGWSVSRESFYHMGWLPRLKLRVTYGYSGNVDKSVTALLTSQSLFNNRYGAPYSRLVNPPNPDLRWERIRQTNFGLDFATANNRVSGSIEYYLKNGTDLMGYAPLAPSSGLGKYKGNTSDMKGLGLDIKLTSNNIIGIFTWKTNFLFSYAHDWVTRYKVQPATISTYISGYINPIVGKPVSALYSYKWAGLDSKGNPQGYLSGKVSKDYAAMINSTDRSDMKYNGSTVPTIFGGLRNSFSWKQLSLSFNVTFKLGYYFRRKSINYDDLFRGVSAGHKDYSLRWQQPGDEKKTFVPSMIYPDDPNRDRFYQYSDVLIERGDVIRLQDVRLNYTLDSTLLRQLPFTGLNVFLYARNLGILWRANDEGIDPDANPSGYHNIVIPQAFSAGININF